MTGQILAPACGPTRTEADFLAHQIEIWLSILVRKLLKRGSFTSVEDLQARVFAFIDYYNGAGHFRSTPLSVLAPMTYIRPASRSRS